MRILVRAVITALTTCFTVSTAVGAPPAAAVEVSPQFWNISDGRDARKGIDVKVTYLSVATPGYYVLKLQGYEFLKDKLNAVAVSFDTTKVNAGPEFRVRWLLPQDGDGHAGIRLAKIDTWDEVGRTVSCAGLDRTVDYNRDIVRLIIPRACLNRPSRVRWNVYTGQVVDYLDSGKIRGYYDDVPERNKFVAGFWVG